MMAGVEDGEGVSVGLGLRVGVALGGEVSVGGSEVGSKDSGCEQADVIRRIKRIRNGILIFISNDLSPKPKYMKRSYRAFLSREILPGLPGL